MSFEQAWDSARYNEWYWISWGAMLIGPWVGTFVVTRFVRGRRASLRSLLLIGLSIAWFVLTLISTGESIRRKWSIRMDAAKTPAQMEEVASRDSANFAFTPVIAAAWGVATLATCAVSAWLYRRRLLGTHPKTIA